MEFLKTENGFIYGSDARIITERLASGNLAINSTYVGEVFRGQGIARKLVMLVVDQACSEGVKIVPRCSYALKVLSEDPNLAVLIAIN